MTYEEQETFNIAALVAFAARIIASGGASPGIEYVPVAIADAKALIEALDAEMADEPTSGGAA